LAEHVLDGMVVLVACLARRQTLRAQTSLSVTRVVEQ
jgi:hypothetical protein